MRASSIPRHCVPWLGSYRHPARGRKREELEFESGADSGEFEARLAPIWRLWIREPGDTRWNLLQRPGTKSLVNSGVQVQPISRDHVSRRPR